MLSAPILTTALAVADVAYIANQNSSDLSVIDLDAETEFARICVIATGDMTIEATLTTGNAPAGLAVSDDGAWLVSANLNADQVSIFNPDDLSLRHAVKVGERPFGVSIAADGRVFSGNVGSDSISVVDPVTGEVITEISVGARPYGVAIAKNMGFVTNQHGGIVSVFDLETLDPIMTIDVGEYPEGIDVTADGKMVVVANWLSNTVSLLDTATLTMRGEIDTGNVPRTFGRFIAPMDGSTK